MAKAVAEINKLKPNVVVISGDILDVDHSLLDEPQKLKQISRRIRKIKAPEGVYAVAGNHDPQTDDPCFCRFLKNAGIRLLDDEVKTLSAVNLIGRTDSASNHRKETAFFSGKTDAGKPVIVLDHRPEEIEGDIQLGADLVLCGHTHRGQFFPVNLFTKWANGSRYFYGHHIHGNSHSIVTSGVGFFALPVRIGTRNEIVDIHLQV